MRTQGPYKAFISAKVNGFGVGVGVGVGIGVGLFNNFANLSGKVPFLADDWKTDLLKYAKIATKINMAKKPIKRKLFC